MQLNKLEIDTTKLSATSIHLTSAELALIDELAHKLRVKSRTKLILSMLFKEVEAQSIDVEAFTEDEVKRVED